MSSDRLRSLVAGGGLATIAAVALAVASTGSSPAVAADPPGVLVAEGLANAPLPDGFDNAVASTGPVAEQRAKTIASSVPLPPGETFDDIRYDQADYADADLEGLLEFNAACKWWIADADAPTKETAKVVRVIPAWPTMRAGDRHRAADAFKANGDPELAAQVLAFCRASVR